MNLCWTDLVARQTWPMSNDDNANLVPLIGFVNLQHACFRMAQYISLNLHWLWHVTDLMVIGVQYRASEIESSLSLRETEN